MKCRGCKLDFSKDELFEIPYGEKGNIKRLCKDCNKERISAEKFSECVCRIFGLKTPGPILYSQRKLIMKKGYTSDTIVEVLEYLNSIKSLKWKDNKDLTIIQYMTEENVEKMQAYRHFKEYQEKKNDEKMLKELQKVKYKVTEMKYIPTEKKEVGYNINDYLECEDF